MRFGYTAAIAIIAATLSGNAFAQVEMVAPPPAPGLAKSVSPWVVAAGVVGVAVVADIVTRGAVSRPLLRLIGINRVAGGAAARAAVP